MRRAIFVMGIVFTGLIALVVSGIVYLGVAASYSAEGNSATAVQLVDTVSTTWSPDLHQEAFTPTALAQATTVAGRRALRTMSRLGRLRSTSNARQTGYAIDFDSGTKATVTFDGQFDHGSARVTVILRFDQDRARLVELDMKQIRLRVKRQRRAAV